MDLEDLRAAQVDERGTDSLQPLPATFYEQAADYLAELRGRRDVLAERSDDPFGSAEVRRLTDELETAEEVVEAVYERRVGKVVKRASLAAAGMPADDEGLTQEERALFADLVERIETNRATVLDSLDDEGGAGRSADDRPPSGGRASGSEPADAPEAPPDEPADAALDATDAMGEPGPDGPGRGASEGRASDDGPEPDGGRAADGEPTTGERPGGTEPDRLTVRITADVGEIYGVDDRVYTLGSEDVVTLPEANARPLLERGAAQRVD